MKQPKLKMKTPKQEEKMGNIKSHEGKTPMLDKHMHEHHKTMHKHHTKVAKHHEKMMKHHSKKK